MSLISKNMILQAQQLFGENEVIGENKRYVTRFGLSQKLVNMTFKYLYVFCDYTNLKIDFSQCDCPLDSAILNEINYKDNVWSKLTEEQYDMCQSKISENLKGLTLDNELKQIANLAFDFIKW